MSGDLLQSINSFMAKAPTAVEFTVQHIAFLFANSIVLGVLLSVVTYYTTKRVMVTTEGKKSVKMRQKLILGASNILFLCVGLTGLMILVNNNLARALAIGAAMSMIRFRANLRQKSLGSNFLFGVIAGVACGLNELAVAWIVAVVYILLQVSLNLILRPSPQEELEEDAENGQ